MTGKDRPELRISDADRERAIQLLNDAVAEGRLTLAEFEERNDAVLRARTASEVAPHLADLPGASAVTGPEYGEVRATMSSVQRQGRWVVPRRLLVHSRAGRVKLDFTEAVISHPVIELTLELYAGSVELVLPEGASVDVEQVETGMVASSAKVRKLPTSTEPVGEPHVVVSGKQWAGSLTVRRQRRFLGRRW